MGADLLLIAIPKLNDPQRYLTLADHLTEDELVEFAGEMMLGNEDAGSVRAALEEFVTAVTGSDGERHRQPVELKLGDRSWYFVGGTSWGDDPCDLWGAAQIVNALFPAGQTNAVTLVIE